MSFTGLGEDPIVTNTQSKTIISFKDGEMDVVMQATSDDKTTLNHEYYNRKASSGYTMYFFDNLDASKNFTQNVMTIDLNDEDPLGLSGRYKAFTYDGKAYTAPGSLDDLGDALGSLGLEGVVDVSNVKSTEKSISIVINFCRGTRRVLTDRCRSSLERCFSPCRSMI